MYSPCYGSPLILHTAVFKAQNDETDYKINVIWTLIVQL